MHVEHHLAPPLPDSPLPGALMFAGPHDPNAEVLLNSVLNNGERVPLIVPGPGRWHDDGSWRAPDAGTTAATTRRPASPRGVTHPNSSWARLHSSHDAAPLHGVLLRRPNGAAVFIVAEGSSDCDGAFWGLAAPRGAAAQHCVVGGETRPFLSAAAAEDYAAESWAASAATRIARLGLRPAHHWRLSSGNASTATHGGTARGRGLAGLPTAYTTGTRQMLVMRIAFQDAPSNFPSLAYTQTVIGDSVAHWTRMSFGTVKMVATVLNGSWTLPLNASASPSAGSVDSAAQALALAAGFNPANYNHCVWLLPWCVAPRPG